MVLLQSSGVCLVEIFDDLGGLEHLHPGVWVGDERDLEDARLGHQARSNQEHVCMHYVCIVLYYVSIVLYYVNMILE